MSKRARKRRDREQEGRQPRQEAQHLIPRRAAGSASPLDPGGAHLDGGVGGAVGVLGHGDLACFSTASRICSRSAAGACSPPHLRPAAPSGAPRCRTRQAGAHSSRCCSSSARRLPSHSWSRKSQTSASTSEQSVSWGLPQLMTRPPSARRGRHRQNRAVAADEPALAGDLGQQVAKLPAAAVQPRHHRADRRAHDLRDLLVREALDVGEVHRDPEVLRQLLQGFLDVVVGQPVHRLDLGGAQPAARCALGLGELPVGDLLGRRLQRLPLPACGSR